MNSSWAVKVIAILIVLQLAALALMNNKLSRIDSRLDEQSTSVRKLSVNTSDPRPERVLIDAKKLPGLDAAALRRIIREELDAQATSMVAAPVNSPTASTPNGPDPAPPLDPAENAERLEYVRDELDYYIGLGQISKSEMAKLQREIAQIDPANRQLMMKKMMAAFSSGKLKRNY